MPIRRNLILKPSMEDGAGGWSRNALPSDATYPSDGGAFGTRYARYTLTSGSTGSIQQQRFVPAQTQYACSLYMRVNAPISIQTRIIWANSGFPNTVGSIFELPANVWTRVSVSGTSPDYEGTYMSVDFGPADTGQNVRQWFIGDTIDHDAGLLEEGRLDIASYFDGSFPDAGLVQYEWEGTANNSVSRTIPPSLPERDIPEPYGQVVSNNTKSNMTVTYRSGWLG